MRKRKREIEEYMDRRAPVMVVVEDVSLKQGLDERDDGAVEAVMVGVGLNPSALHHEQSAVAAAVGGERDDGERGHGPRIWCRRARPWASPMLATTPGPGFDDREALGGRTSQREEDAQKVGMWLGI